MPGQPQQLALFARCRERQSARSTGGGTYVSSHPPVGPGDVPPSTSGGAIPVNFSSLVTRGPTGTGDLGFVLEKEIVRSGYLKAERRVRLAGCAAGCMV